MATASAAAQSTQPVKVDQSTGTAIFSDSNVPESHPSKIAPKPTPVQFAAFKSAFDQCRDGKGAPLSADKRQKFTARLQQVETNSDQLDAIQYSELVEDAIFLLMLDLPHYAGNYDKLTADEARKLETETGIPRFELPAICPSNTSAALPILRWLADREKGSRLDHAYANFMLGLLAQSGIGDKASMTNARAYYLKSSIFNEADAPPQFAALNLWSDGQDNDFFANIKRQGLQPYFDRVMAGPSGRAVREFQAKRFVRSDPEKTRKLLMSDNLFDARLLLNLEYAALIKPSHTQADLIYWRDLVQRSTPLILAHHGPVIWPRLAATAAHLNGGILPVNLSRPLLAQAYISQEQRSPKAFNPEKLPISMRALIAPDGAALFVIPCGKLDSTTADDELRFAEFAHNARTNLKPLTPVIKNGRPMYSWVILPGTVPENGKRDCRANPMLYGLTLPPPPPPSSPQ